MIIHGTIMFLVSRVWLQLRQGAACSKPAASTVNAWPALKSQKHCFDRLHVAAHKTGSCRSSCTLALIIFWGLFLSKTETPCIVRQAVFSRNEASSPTGGDFIALECRQGNLWLWGYRKQPFLLLLPLRSRPDIQHGLINFLSNAELPYPYSSWFYNTM